MLAPPAFAESTILKALFRTLAFAVIIEALFNRLVTIPAQSVSRPWVESLHASTGRAGDLMFVLSFALLLPTLLAIAYASMRAGAWPGSLNTFVAVGVIALVVVTIIAAIAIRGPAFAVGFTAISLLVGLSMLAGMFESRDDFVGRCLAVLLAGALLCGDLAMVSDWLREAGLRSLPTGIEGDVGAAARWMLYGAGALAYPAFTAPTASYPKITERAASYGVSAATALALVVGTISHPPLLERLRDALGGDASVAGSVLRTTAAASALFLATFTTCRGFMLPPLRFRSYGLLFLLLSGFPHRIAYQHLLAVLGLALITSSAAPSTEGTLSTVGPIPSSEAGQETTPRDETSPPL